MSEEQTPVAETEKPRTDMIPPREAVKAPEPVSAEPETAQEPSETDKKPETETQEAKKEELSEAEQRRKQRNRERWQSMQNERRQALAEVQRLRAELDRIKQPVDYSQIDDPDEAQALRTVQKLREMQAGDYETQAAEAQKKADAAIYEAWEAVRADARERMPDFDQVVTPQTPIHERAAPFIVESEKSAELAYYLGKNPDVAMSLYQKFDQAPAQALIELGRLEARLSAPPPKPVSQAPKPAPMLQGSSSPPAFDPFRAGVGDLQAELRKAGVIR